MLNITMILDISIDTLKYINHLQSRENIIKKIKRYKYLMGTKSKPMKKKKNKTTIKLYTI